MKTIKAEPEYRRRAAAPDESTDATRSTADGSPDEREAFRTSAVAQNLRDASGAAYLYAALGGFVGEGVEPNAFLAYVRQFLADCGAPRDPIEAMLIEQLALTHHSIGRLFARCGMADQCDEATAYAVAAARLAGEFRRSAVALREYRGGVTGRLRVVADHDAAVANGRCAVAGEQA